MNFITKKVPVYFMGISALFGAIISYSFVNIANHHSPQILETIPSTPTFASSCGVNFSRLSGRKFIKPLLFAEKTCEAESFSSIRNSLSDLIENMKTTGDINSASVYIRVFGKGEWMSINNELKYQPGSLFKVPLMITYLRISEQKPNFLEQKLTFNQITQESKGLKQEFLKEHIKLGNSYSIRDLLKYMIVHSDNNATMLLMNNIPLAELTKTITDLGLSKDLTNNDAVISAQDYSLFWLALYNGSYLSFENSDYALTLLSQCDFTEGIVKGIPPNTRIAHKFGEKGNQNNHAFHETGIIYINNNPYLITVMTEGKDQKKLPKIIQEISKVVYTNIQSLTM